NTPTTYHVDVLNGRGCLKKDSVNVELKDDAPMVSVFIDTAGGYSDSLCVINGDTTRLIAILSAGSVPSCVGTTDTCTTALSDSIGATSSIYNLLHGIGSFTGNSLRKQYIILASELTGIGMSAEDKISAIAYNINGNSASSISNVVLSMGCTDSASFDNSNVYLAGLTLVKDSFTYQPPAAGGWDKITFDFPYVWDGSSNLVFEICQDEVFTGTNTMVERDILVEKRALMTFQSSSGACSATSGTASTIFPLIKFSYCAASSIPDNIGFSWSPTTGLSDPTNDTTLAYPGHTTTYVVTVMDTTDTVACTELGYIGVIDTCSCGTWLGTVDTDWFEPDNWSSNCGIPECTMDVYIAPGAVNMPVIENGIGQVKSITIGLGATLTIDPATGGLSICP
ncbi:MAG: hypothetical protein IH946_08225, partial [Bacteroidetes bacterium]|nr:hypothetical protein [Bacteroidota bacterium]